jgi:hypothetical protein
MERDYDFDTENPDSVPHVAGSPTSKAGAKGAKHKVSEQQREIRRLVAESPGLTRGQLEDSVRRPPFRERYLHQSVGPRVDALRRSGYLCTSGTRAFHGRHQEQLYPCKPGSPEHHAELEKFPTPPRVLRAKLDAIRKLAEILVRDRVPGQIGYLDKIREHTAYKVKTS